MTAPPVLTYVPLKFRVPAAEPGEVFEAALRPLRCLAGVVEPLAIRLCLGARPADTPYVDRRLEVERAMWQLQREHLPDGVEPAMPPGRPFIVATTPELSLGRLRSWFAAAVDQPSPSPGAVIMQHTLVCEDRRSRLLTAGGASTCLVKMDEMTLERALSREGVVAFPMPRVEAIPPVRLRVSNDGDALIADLWVSWTPWATPGTAEADAVKAALDRLLEEGWVWV